VFVGDVHQTYEVENSLLVGHITQVIHNAAVLLCRKPGFEMICVEPLDDFCTVLQEPGTVLLAGQLEHGIVVPLPELQSTVVDFLNRPSKLGERNDDPTSVLHVCTLPLGIIYTGCSNNDILGP
jgi:hypothetical protein